MVLKCRICGSHECTTLSSVLFLSSCRWKWKPAVLKRDSHKAAAAAAATAACPASEIPPCAFFGLSEEQPGWLLGEVIMKPSAFISHLQTFNYRRCHESEVITLFLSALHSYKTTLMSYFNSLYQHLYTLKQQCALSFIDRTFYSVLKVHALNML